MSLSSNTTAEVIEVSYSSSSDCPTMRRNKRSRRHYSKDSSNAKRRSRLQQDHHHHHHQSNVVSSSKFKGVVSQMNGHWGAQIYAKHQRIWLGTFRTEKEAATAYDSAAIKLRDGDSFRNFPWTSTTAQEPSFQSQFSTELVLSMIKDGSYPSKFAEYLNSKHQIKDLVSATSRTLGTGPSKEEYSCRQLFQKELTPSDVGKLNRLVIPKKNALKYFSHVSDGEKGESADDVQLVFHDTSMRLWKFRYCYWKSSQSYVFTRGWNKFVKDKGLKANDTVIFSRCQCNDGLSDVSSFCVIDVSYSSRSAQNAPVVGDDTENNCAVRDAEEDYEEQALVLELGRYSDVTEDDEEANLVNEDVRLESVPASNKGFRLFGVEIS